MERFIRIFQREGKRGTEKKAWIKYTRCLLEVEACFLQKEKTAEYLEWHITIFLYFYTLGKLSLVWEKIIFRGGQSGVIKMQTASVAEILR